MEGKGEFNIVIEKVDKEKAAKAVREFARLFSMDERAVACILGAAPIHFVSGLARLEVKAVIDKLKEISKLGVEFRITAREPKRIPRVNWPQKPHFTAGWSGANGIVFDWQDQAFVCPSCGETFLFKRMGKVSYQSQEGVDNSKSQELFDKETPVQAKTVEPLPADTIEPLSEPVIQQRPAAVQMPKKAATKSLSVQQAKPQPKEDVLEVVEEKPDEILDLNEDEIVLEPQKESIEEPEVITLEEYKGDKIEVVEKSDVLEPLQESTESLSADDLIKEEVIEEVPLEELPPLEPVSDSQAVEISSETSVLPKSKAGNSTNKDDTVEELQLEDANQDQSDFSERQSIDGVTYNVFISNVKDNSKREEVAKLISQSRGISVSDAKKLTTKTMIPVAKNLPKDKAEKVLNDFKRLKVTGRITRSVGPRNNS